MDDRSLLNVRVARETYKPAIGGILCIVDGALILVAAFLAIGGALMLQGEVDSFMLAIGLVFLLFASLPVVGGACAIRRRLWGLALAGSIVATISIWPLGVPALVLIATSRDEFE